MWHIYLSAIISAVLYGIAYWYPACCWWGTFASLVLVVSLRLPRAALAWRCGFLWGLCAYAMHLYGVAVGIVTLANTHAWYAWLPGVMLIFYMALCTSFFWAFGVWCEQKLKDCVHVLCVRTIWLWIYWLWVTYGCLFFCGRWEGCLLANPLIPWAAYPQLLWPVVWCDVVGATLLLCMFSAFVAHCIVHKKYMRAIFMVSVFWLVSAMQRVPLHDASDWHYEIGVVNTPIVALEDDPSICTLVYEYVACERARKPALCGVLFPESCIYPWRLCATTTLAEQLAPLGACDYIIGSFYDDNGKHRNSCYWLRDGIVRARFDKRHAMPLIERLPWFLQHTPLKKLFFSTMPEIVPSSNERPVMQIGDALFVPYICSELFFNRLPDDVYPKLPIVALINDRWAPPYLQELMYLGAVVQAHAWQREIVYVSYTRCALINEGPIYVPIVAHT